MKIVFGTQLQSPQIDTHSYAY